MIAEADTLLSGLSGLLILIFLIWLAVRYFGRR